MAAAAAAAAATAAAAAAAAAPVAYAYTPTTALLIVDAQNDFCHPDGALPVPAAAAAVTAINAHVAAAAAAGAPVVLTADWHPPVTPHFVTAGGRWPVHCVAGTWGARWVDGLTIPPAAVVIRKGVGGEDGYSGFGNRPVHGGGEGAAAVPQPVDTGLAAALTARRVTAVVVAGVAADVCVRATALDGRARGWPVALARRAVAYVEPAAVGGVERELAAAGVTFID